MKKYIRIWLCVCLFLLPLISNSQNPPIPNPAIEVRAVWLTTNWGLDWPTQNKSAETQKEELRVILDEFKAMNFNVVLFQARARGRTFYLSDIEPVSPYFNKEAGFDPLAFAVEECHKRGMECHAWIVTFPMERESRPILKTQQNAAKRKKPDYYKLMDDVQWHLDPGHPAARARVLAIVKEIVTKYDVDGIHFDYIRYPDDPRKFPDADTYRTYGKDMTLADWRRDNINKFVFAAYDMVKSIKKWVQVSSAPLGRYKVLPHIRKNDGWTAYETVYQDAGYWMKSGKHDLLFPMMYHRKKYFDPYLEDWLKNSNGRPIVPGLGVYQMTEPQMNWALADITEQMQATRITEVAGQAYFRAKNILNNDKGIKNIITKFNPYPAKLPPLTWLDTTIPNPPIKLRVHKDENKLLHIEWEAPDSTEQYTYTVYFSAEENIDTNNPRNILSTGIRGNSFSFPIILGEFGVYYTVTASDRFHNESKPCEIAFFSHTPYEK